MDFFESQRLAKRTSFKLQLLFYLIVGLVSLITTLFITGLLTSTGDLGSVFAQIERLVTLRYSQKMFDVFTVSFGVIAVIMLLKSLWTIFFLRRDPSSICRRMGAKQIFPNTEDSAEKRYFNLIEEMSIASSVPVPHVYLLEDQSINAFATGFDINSAAICITTGALRQLTRDELQAVIAHEYSHILNGDMKINLKLIAMLAGLLVIFQIGSHLARSNQSRRSSKKGNGAIIGLGLMFIGGLGYLGGLFLKAAISRQREYLADASSVQFTRNPQGIVGALKKIYIHSSQGLIEHPEANIASHMFLVEGVKSSFSMASHPPLADRIKAVDQHFNLEQFEALEREQLAAKMNALLNADTHEAEEASSQKEESSSSATARLERIMPLFLAYREEQSGGIQQMVLNLLRRDTEDFKSLNVEDLEVILEKLVGELKTWSPQARQNLLNILTNEVFADHHVSFLELLILGYLKPTLSSVNLKERRISSAQVQQMTQLMLSFYYYLDNNQGREVNFDLLPKDSINLAHVLAALETLRFAPTNIQENLINELKAVAMLNGEINSYERVIFSLICQSISLPGSLALAA